MIKIMFDNTKYSNKPDINEVKKLQNRLRQTEIEIKDLANNLAQGCTFKPAYLNGRTSNDFISQQLFALDFDNNSDIQTELNRCKELNIIPCFGYTTFSHTELKNKFRLVFCNDEIITDIDERNKLQKSLILAFNNCDKQTMDASRIFFGGRKLIYENYNSIIKGSEIVAKWYKEDNKSNSVSKPKTVPTINNEYHNDNIEAIKKLDSKLMKSLISLNSGISLHSYIQYNDISVQSKPLIFTQPIDLYNFLDTIDLYDFLDVEGKIFRCVIHDDKNPSAGIEIKDNGHYVYHCFGCGFKGGIIHIVEKLSGKSRYHAIKFLKEVYNLQLYTDEQKEYIEILNENKRYINSGKLEEEFPVLWSYIKHRKQKLINIINYAIDNIGDSEYVVNDIPIFYGSLNYLSDVFECKSKNTTNKTIQLFCLLNLLNKVDPKLLPEKLLAKHIQNKQTKIKESNHAVNQINTYQIPSYSIDMLSNSNNKAIILKNNNFTLNGLSREYIIRTFGDDLANELFPQFKDKGLSKKSIEKTNEITIIAIDCINNKKYVSENEIIEIYRKNHNYKISEKVVKTQIKRSIQEILDGYDLIRVRANKQLKEHFGISSNGYPFLILKNEDYIKFMEGCEK